MQVMSLLGARFLVLSSRSISAPPKGYQPSFNSLKVSLFLCRAHNNSLSHRQQPGGGSKAGLLRMGYQGRRQSATGSPCAWGRIQQASHASSSASQLASGGVECRSSLVEMNPAYPREQDRRTSEEGGAGEALLQSSYEPRPPVRVPVAIASRGRGAQLSPSAHKCLGLFSGRCVGSVCIIPEYVPVS